MRDSGAGLVSTLPPPQRALLLPLARLQKGSSGRAGTRAGGSAGRAGPPSLGRERRAARPWHRFGAALARGEMDEARWGRGAVVLGGKRGWDLESKRVRFVP